MEPERAITSLPDPSRAPAVRVLRPQQKLPVQPPRRIGLGSLDTFFFRVVAGILVASVPVSSLILLIVFLTASQNETDAAQAQAEMVARSASAQVTVWLDDRQAQLRDVAGSAQDQVGHADLTPSLQSELTSGDVFDALAIADTRGNVVAEVGPASYFVGLAAQPWFTESLSAATLQPVAKLGDRLTWFATAPVVDTGGNPRGVVVADLKLSRLGGLLEPYGTNSASLGIHEVHVVDSTHHLVYSSDWYSLADDVSLAAKGAMRIVAEGALADQALKTGAGSARITDYRHHDVLAGYFPIPGPRWVVIASTDAAAALAPVFALGRLTILLGMLGLGLLIGVGIVITRQMLKPIRSLSQLATRVEAGDLTGRLQPQGGVEMRLLGATFNSMLERMSAVLSRLRGEVTESATALAAAADHLATAAEEQTTAVTATSGSMTRLELASASIAKDMDRVARQAGEMRTNIEVAQADLHASSDRAHTLMQRVTDVDHILATIGDVADQTNLLALNAAIEAARAGDAGRGFAVVADEVRRLAERSKAASTDITKLLEGTRADTNLTVKALQRRSEQMEEWLKLTASMTEVSGQVQVATQEQRSSTQMAVGAIDNIVESSRSVEGTARQLAEAAARQGRLAKDLAGAGWEPDEEA